MPGAPDADVARIEPETHRTDGLGCATPLDMATLELTHPEIAGRIAYIDPSKQWGYLHGPLGERVYFHATGVRDGIATLELGAEVRYHIADGGDQLCAAQVIRSTRRGR